MYSGLRLQRGHSPAFFFSVSSFPAFPAAHTVRLPPCYPIIAEFFSYLGSVAQFVFFPVSFADAAIPVKKDSKRRYTVTEYRPAAKIALLCRDVFGPQRRMYPSEKCFYICQCLFQQVFRYFLHKLNIPTDYIQTFHMFRQYNACRFCSNLVDKEDYLPAMERSPVRDLEIKTLLKAALRYSSLSLKYSSLPGIHK